MKKEVVFSEVEDRIIEVKGKRVMLDRDVASVYGIETKDVNRAVRNNPEKFPRGYVIEVNDRELAGLRLNNFTANLSKNRYSPKAFTEKGLYMLATILKSPQATTPLEVVETINAKKQK